jgi:hypothetical protein
MAGNKVYNGGDITRYYFLTLAADQIIKEGIIGNTAELGVYKGNTASILVKLARLTGTDAYLFDTYEGFSSRDLDGIDADESMAFEDTSLENVVRLVGEEKTHFVKGHFPGTINQIPDNLVFSFVHIDCDLYAPFKDALEYFYPRLTRGGMLVMHDYSSLRWKGAEKAIDDFFSDKPEFVIPIPDKSGSAVIRKL